MRAVLDTDILVSAYNFPGGAPEAVYRLALEGRMDLVTSPPLLAELGRVLVEKFECDSGRAEHSVAQVALVGFVVRPAKRIGVVKEDPADDRVLEAAAEGRADVIVSGDRHLLRPESWRGIRIQSAAQAGSV